MRKKAIDETNGSPIRLPPSAHRDAAELAWLLNAAAKPDGYPHTNVSKSRSVPEPRTIPKGFALGLAVALVLDMLETGEIGKIDLLRRVALLKDVDPWEKDRRAWDKIMREKYGEE